MSDPSGRTTNADLAELLARSADEEQGHRRRALRRAARHALVWPEEVAALVEADRDLTGLSAVGPWIAGRLRAWVRERPDVPAVPTERAGFRTMAWARAVLAEDPWWRRDLLADLQTHSTWSDGAATLSDMAGAASDLGHRYVAATDHSAGQRIPVGMDGPTIEEQGAAIDALNRTLGRTERPFRILRGLEMNLTPEGTGDTDPATLGRLELVLGAFHSKLRITDDQTARYLAAVRNPTIHVLAHPRGRRWDARRGLQADWPRVFRAAAEAGTALEVDCFPDRQDLELDLLEVARDAGAWVSVGTDAHATSELRAIDLGCASLAAVGFPRKRVLNYLTADEVVAWTRGSSS